MFGAREGGELYAGGSAPIPDTTLPTVSVTAPAGGATVSGASVTVSASASDNIGVVGVQFKVDGANVGAEDTVSPYGISWNSTTVSNGAHTITAVARDVAGNTTTSAGISMTVNNADTTPLSSYALDGTSATTPTTAPDSVGGNNGTLVNGPTWTTDRLGAAFKAISLDGVNDYISMGDVNDIGTSDVTITAWIKPPNVNQSSIIVGKRLNSGTFTQYALRTGYVNNLGSGVSSKKIGAIFYGQSGGLNSTNAQFYRTTDDIIDGNWHHVVMLRKNGVGVKFYIDGVERAVTADIAGTTNVNVDNSAAFGIGAAVEGGGLGPYTGLIDDVRIYNKALTANEAYQLYNSGQ